MFLGFELRVPFPRCDQYSDIVSVFPEDTDPQDHGPGSDTRALNLYPDRSEAQVSSTAFLTSDCPNQLKCP